MGAQAPWKSVMECLINTACMHFIASQNERTQSQSPQVIIFLCDYGLVEPSHDLPHLQLPTHLSLGQTSQILTTDRYRQLLAHRQQSPSELPTWGYMTQNRVLLDIWIHVSTGSPQTQHIHIRFWQSPRRKQTCFCCLISAHTCRSTPFAKVILNSCPATLPWHCKQCNIWY